MSENYDQSDHIELSTAVLDQEFSNRDVLIATIKQYFHARNEVVVLDKHSDQRKVTFKCYFGGQYRNALTKEEKAIVRDLASSGTGAAPTLAYLRDKTGNQWTTRKEIYNEKVVARAEFLDGRSPIQALYDEICSGDFIFNAMVDSNGALSGLFFCHEKSAELARRFNIVFIMDCTYKTNRFGMPLLNIVGITATYKTFNAGFAFICNETEPMYVWALQSFELNLLCVWHVNKNILANATKKFDDICDTDDYMDDWSQLVYCFSEQVFEDKWTKFQIKWRPKQDTLVHEGNHFVIKRILGIVNNDLLTVFNTIRLLLDTQFTELNTKMELEKSSLAHRHSLDFMKSLVKKISKHALDKMLDQYKKLADMDDSDECTGLFQTSIGVPCRHEIKRRIEENRRFNIDDIHCQWHLHAPPAVLPVAVRVEPFSSPRKNLMQSIKRRLYEADDDQAAVVMARLNEASQRSLQPLSNPELATKRGRPAGSTKRKAIQREKSLFEHATGRKCSKCGQAGHNSRTCNVQTFEQQ
ncbi:hypothetical protein BASA50_005829 [Batrachochytrium salamandrivorans]|uniref:CCHC-type domain-containing protein n=1 Tax=Batrachochytrium salamandrivorans TaxID=1357716 RepID=A0ABQ8FC11_9FUNG|nr:hypothetical protein BASA50_005829 [Batrachochytrium salamandrivorans]